MRFSSGTDTLGVLEEAEPADPSFSFSCADVLAWRGTGEAVLPLAEGLLPFFSLVEDGVTISSGGRSFSGVPSSPSSTTRRNSTHQWMRQPRRSHHKTCRTTSITANVLVNNCYSQNYSRLLMSAFSIT